MHEFTVHLTGDKSITHRAFILASLARGQSVIHNVGDGADLESTRSVLKQLGVKIDPIQKGSWRIYGVDGIEGYSPPNTVLNCGNSGTTIRLLGGLLSGLSYSVTLDGDHSLRTRPMKRLEKVIGPLNRSIMTANLGTAPISVGGHLNTQKNICPQHLADSPTDSSTLIIDTQSSSAQLKSAALFAALSSPLAVTVRENRPSRDHTERMLAALWSTEKSLYVPPIPQAIPAFEFTSPGDFSSASFWMAISALSPANAPHICLQYVNLNPTRMGLLRIIQRMGLLVNIQVQTESLGEPIGQIRISPLNPSKTLKSITLSKQEVVDALDELPIVALLASFANGRTVVRGAQELKVKESDRLIAMGTALSKLGVPIKTLADGWEIEGDPNRIFKDQINLDSLGDHRIAMCLLIAQLKCPSGYLSIHGVGCLNISYPEFPSQFAAYRTLLST